VLKKKTSGTLLNRQEHIAHLTEKLERLLQEQQEFSQRVQDIQQELKALSEEGEVSQGLSAMKSVVADQSVQGSASNQSQPPPEPVAKSIATPSMPKAKSALPYPKKQGKKTDFEKLIGENILNKVGILITILGVGIGVRYAIENDLISPDTRIILGYVVALILGGFAWKLKKNYNSFSAVLLSGATSISYFITFFACSFYDLIPHSVAYGLMIGITAFTVYSSLLYQRQVIAHIGLVGAYAIPFLLSQQTGSAPVLFTYMAIVNLGVLSITLKQSWKPLLYSSFLMTWAIFTVWYQAEFMTSSDFATGMIFNGVFYLIFYSVFVSFKLRQKAAVAKDEILVAVANTFLFYAIGYGMLDAHKIGEHFLGLFTLMNAMVHFIAAMVVRQFRMRQFRFAPASAEPLSVRVYNDDLFLLFAALVAVFACMAVPVQLDGSWVTMLWSGLAVALFAVGRTRNLIFYERVAYGLVVLAFGSLVQDWLNGYGHYAADDPNSRLTFVFNMQFAGSLLFVGALAAINSLHWNPRFPLSPQALKTEGDKALYTLVSASLPFFLIVGLFFAGCLEVIQYWDQQYLDSAVEIAKGKYPVTIYNEDLEAFGNLWVIHYFMAFAAVMCAVNLKMIRSKNLGLLNLGLLGLGIYIYLTMGLGQLVDLRESYIQHQIAENAFAEQYAVSSVHLWIRYVSYGFFLAVIVALVALVKHSLDSKLMQSNQKLRPEIFLDIVLYGSVIWLLSSEWLHWADVTGNADSGQLGVSLIWGVSSLLLIVRGIWKKIRHMRIGAFVLFGITLGKLFFLDMADFSTIHKTIVFVVLGVLMLVGSFLYNRNNNLIK